MSFAFIGLSHLYDHNKSKHRQGQKSNLSSLRAPLPYKLVWKNKKEGGLKVNIDDLTPSFTEMEAVLL